MEKLRAFVISLPNRTDRREAFRKAWDEAALDCLFNVQFLPGITIPAQVTGPARMILCEMACAISHRRAVAMATAMGLDQVLVMEDDSEPLDFAGALEAFLVNDLSPLEIPWHTVNLGGCSAQWRPATPLLRSADVPGSETIVQVRGMVTTHAILYHSRVFEDLLAAVPSELEFSTLANSVSACRPYDQWLGSFGVMLAPLKPFFSQSGSSSDILGMPHQTSVKEQILKTHAALARDSALRRNQNALPVAGDHA